MGCCCVKYSVLLILLLAACWAPRALAVEAESTRRDEVLASFFQQHCLRCHGADTAEAELRLDRLEEVRTPREEAARWQKILKRLQAGEMPPEDEPQPSKTETASAVRQITAVLDAAATKRRE